MGKVGTRNLIRILKVAIRDILEGPVWDFRSDIIDWEGSNGL
jgi:hypothetical protein